MKRSLTTALAGACAILIAACGGHAPATKVTVPPKAAVAPKAAAVPVKVSGSHVCDVKDYAMGCALPPQSLPDVVRSPTAAAPSIQGVDFGWSCPVSSARNFGASYLSYDTSKNWTRSCVDEFHRQGKATVAVFEAGASDATGGYSLGYSQAQEAAKQVAALGAGPHQPLPLAIDCDCTGSSLVSYFQGANNAEPGRIDAYGGYDQILYLYQHHLVGHANWQTYAWSGGRWLPASIAPLEQYLNSSAVDYDRAIAPYYGQWPYTPPRPQISCFGAHWQHTKLCNQVRRQDAQLGHRRDQQLSYLKVSNSNAARIQAGVAPLEKRLAVIEGRAALELRKGQFAALKVSAANAAGVATRLAPLQHHLAVIEGRIKLEQTRARLLNSQLEKSLAQYGYHKGASR